MAWMDSLNNPNTRDMLKFFGAGVAALVVGGWALFTWLYPKPDAPIVATPVVYQPAQPQPATLIQTPVAGNGGVALAIHGNGNQVNTGK